MASVTNHPVFGPLVPDQWNEDLLTFREFPYLRAFWHPDRERALSSSYLPANHREWVENWKSHTAELSKVCRNSPVHAALQSFGVYEVTVAVPRNGSPKKPQEAAYCHFADHEQDTCANVVDSLLRYYKFAREHLSDWFDDDCPDDATLEQLGHEVDFDGFLVCRCSSHGMSPLRLAWDPSWDPEHGLLMAVYKDQVISIGTDDVDDFLHDPGGMHEIAWEGMWGRKQMNQAEVEAYRDFIQGYESADDWDP